MTQFLRFVLILFCCGLAVQTKAGPLEFKIRISPEAFVEHRHDLGLYMRMASHRSVYFLDTPNLSLLKKGLVLRVRVNRHRMYSDVTVKIRPLGDVKIPKGLRDLLEVEDDHVDGRDINSGVISEERKVQAVLGVIHRTMEIPTLWSPEQKKLIQILWPKLAWDSLRLYGPVESAEWFPSDWRVKLKKRKTSLPDLHVELWTLPNSGKQIAEVSFKMRRARGIKCREALVTFLEEKGVRTLNGQFKTEFVLRNLASRSQ